LWHRCAQRRERVLRRREHLEADVLPSKRLFEHPPNGAIVVDDPDRFHGFFRLWLRLMLGAQGLPGLSGKRMVKQVRPGSLSTSIMPWCWLMRFWANVRPSPVPPSRPETR